MRSLAVALALQPTLTNLLAGLNILLSHQVRVGDFVELEAEQGGVVTDIGWRSTSIEELPGNTYVIPNARFSEVIVKNYNSFGEGGVVLAVNLRVRDYRDRGHVVHELIKLVHRRYQERGIEISIAPRHISTSAASGRPTSGAPPA